MALLVAGILSCDDKRGARNPQRGTDFSLKDVGGNTVSLSDFSGKVVMLEFWSTNCPSCVASIPELILLQDKYRDKGFEIVAASMDYSVADVKHMIEDKGMNYTVVMSDERVEKQYGIISIPTSFLIDRTGAVVKRHLGFAPGVVLGMENDIKLLLESMPLKFNKDEQE